MPFNVVFQFVNCNNYKTISAVTKLSLGRIITEDISCLELKIVGIITFLAKSA